MQTRRLTSISILLIKLEKAKSTLTLTQVLMNMQTRITLIILKNTKLHPRQRTILTSTLVSSSTLHRKQQTQKFLTTLTRRRKLTRMPMMRLRPQKTMTRVKMRSRMMKKTNLWT